MTNLAFGVIVVISVTYGYLIGRAHAAWKQIDHQLDVTTELVPKTINKEKL